MKLPVNVERVHNSLCTMFDDNADNPEGFTLLSQWTSDMRPTAEFEAPSPPASSHSRRRQLRRTNSSTTSRYPESYRLRRASAVMIQQLEQRQHHQQPILQLVPVQHTEFETPRNYELNTSQSSLLFSRSGLSSIIGTSTRTSTDGRGLPAHIGHVGEPDVGLIPSSSLELSMDQVAIGPIGDCTQSDMAINSQPLSKTIATPRPLTTLSKSSASRNPSHHVGTINEMIVREPRVDHSQWSVSASSSCDASTDDESQDHHLTSKEIRYEGKGRDRRKRRGSEVKGGTGAQGEE